MSMAELARALDVDKATVSRWAKGRIAVARVVDVERITGVSREVLRPDIYGIRPAPPIRTPELTQ